MTIIGLPPLTDEELAQAEAGTVQGQIWRITDFSGLVEFDLPDRLSANPLPDSEMILLAELRIRREGSRVSVQLVAVMPEGD